MNQKSVQLFENFPFIKNPLSYNSKLNVYNCLQQQRFVNFSSIDNILIQDQVRRTLLHCRVEPIPHLRWFVTYSEQTCLKQISMDYLIVYWVSFSAFVLALIILLIQTLKSCLIKYRRNTFTQVQETLDIDTELEQIQRHSPVPYQSS